LFFPRPDGAVLGMKGFIARFRIKLLDLGIRSTFDRRIVETGSAIYDAQIINYIPPLVMIPYLARVLGPESWGVVVFVQAIRSTFNS
jgi:hypothetical protein